MPRPVSLGAVELDPQIPEWLRAGIANSGVTCSLVVDLPLERHVLRCLFAELDPSPSHGRRQGVAMGTPVAAASAVVADAGLSWVSVSASTGAGAPADPVVDVDVGLLQWGETLFALVGTTGITTLGLSAVVDYATRRALGTAPGPQHVAVCNPCKTVGFWFEAAYLPPQFGWPAQEVDAILGALALPKPGDEPQLLAVLGGHPTAARLFARAVAHRLGGYMAVDELAAPAGGLPCVLMLEGKQAKVALHRAVARLEAVVVPPPRGVGAIVVRAEPGLTPHLDAALRTAAGVVRLPVCDIDNVSTEREESA